MLLDDEHVREEFERVHASMDRDTLARVLGVDDSKSCLYQLPSDLLDKTLEAVHGGYEAFAEGVGDTYFTTEQLKKDLDAYLEDGLKEAAKKGYSELGIYWDEEVNVLIPDEGDFTKRDTEPVPYGEGYAMMPVYDFDEDLYNDALEDATDEMKTRAPRAIEARVHDFEWEMALGVINDAGWEDNRNGGIGEVCKEFDYYDNTETFLYRDDPYR